jgi:glycosyltransferase involved in cell wall biosynthesis
VAQAGLTVHPEDEEEISDTLRRLANDADLRARLREKGLAHARRFDWRRTAEATMKVYERASTASRAPSKSSLRSSLIPSGAASK